VARGLRHRIEHYRKAARGVRYRTLARAHAAVAAGWHEASSGAGDLYTRLFAALAAAIGVAPDGSHIPLHRQLGSAAIVRRMAGGARAPLPATAQQELGARSRKAEILWQSLTAEARVVPPIARLPERMRGLCIIRTQGLRPGLLAQAVASVGDQTVPLTPCVVVHGDAACLAAVRDVLAPQRADVVMLHAAAVDRRRGYPCNVALDYLSTHAEAFDYVCLLDDDDRLLPGFAERMTAALRDARADMVYCIGNALPQSGEPFVKYGLLPPIALLGENFIPANAFVVTTGAVVAARARFAEDMDYLEDWDFLLQLVGAGLRAVPLFETLCEFRVTDRGAQGGADPAHDDRCRQQVGGGRRAAARRLSRGAFWRDVLEFPADRRAPLSAHEVRHLLDAAILLDREATR